MKNVRSSNFTKVFSVYFCTEGFFNCIYFFIAPCPQINGLYTLFRNGESSGDTREMKPAGYKKRTALIYTKQEYGEKTLETRKVVIENDCEGTIQSKRNTRRIKYNTTNCTISFPKNAEYYWKKTKCN